MLLEVLGVEQMVVGAALRVDGRSQLWMDSLESICSWTLKYPGW